jgi:hypothetical protein
VPKNASGRGDPRTTNTNKMVCLSELLIRPGVVEILKDLAVYAEVTCWIIGEDKCCNAVLEWLIKLHMDCERCGRKYLWKIPVGVLLLIGTGVVTQGNTLNYLKGRLVRGFLCGNSLSGEGRKGACNCLLH